MMKLRSILKIRNKEEIMEDEYEAIIVASVCDFVNFGVAAMAVSVQRKTIKRLIVRLQQRLTDLDKVTI